MIKLDAFDKRILEVLIENSREQISTIAKKIKLRRENVNYRINRLIKLGLIKEFNTILNEKSLGLSHYVVFVELVKLGEITEKQIIEYLKNSQFMSWIGTSAGRWSLVFDIIIYDKDSNFEEILKKFLKRFGDYIENYEVLKLSKGDYFASKLIGKSRDFHRKIEDKKHAQKFDETDFKILSLLNKDSRKTLVDISTQTNLTPNGINNRIKSLTNNGIISGYTISLNWKKLGYEWFAVQIKLHKYDEEIDNKIESFFKNHKKVVFYYKYLGASWDYDIGVLVQNSDELRDFINEYRKEFSDVSKISDVFLTLEETTGYKMPEGVFG
ncbi:MAG: winged helix-turn-helix transcriptional regulator [Nanoarchaeota archaeon]|nr:winged helix-turn-helix transcriptional regulator [Nanoarchaeota archaeon]